MKHTQLRPLVSGLSIALLALVLSVGVSYVWAGTWTAPGSTPPNGNVDAPVNIGVGHQNKLGSLSINTTASSPDPYGLDVFGISRFFGDVRIGSTTSPASLTVVDASVIAGTANGKVLTSDANGKGTWQTPSGGGVVVKNGNAVIACADYGSSGPGSQAVTFPSAFTSAPTVVITPNWSNYSGDEAPSWWVTNVTTTGFTINVHTQNSSSGCIGNLGAAGRVHWVAVGN